ncbi:TRP-like family, partial [Spinellus fusiger]
MVGIFQASGVAQLTVILIAEVVLLSAHIRNRPYVDAGTNTQYTILSTFRLVITLLNISYVDSLKASITAKQYVAYTQVILHSIVFLCMFILPLKNLIVLAGGLGEDEIYNPTMTSARMSLGR